MSILEEKIYREKEKNDLRLTDRIMSTVFHNILREFIHDGHHNGDGIIIIIIIPSSINSPNSCLHESIPP